MNKERKAIIAGNEISEMRTYILGGFPQKVLIDGKKKSNPMVLFLHGGPGAPIPLSEGCRGMFPELTEKVTMVYWDQFGCGINNHIIDDTFSIDTFVQMTIDLLKHLKEDFPDNKINIFGVSWGSILAAKAAEAEPGLIHKVLIYGQVLKQLTFNDEVFETLSNSNMPDRLKKRLSVIKSSISYTANDVRTVSRWINKYTEGYQAKNGGKAPYGKILRGLLTSPDYTLKDIMAMVINGYRKNTTLISEILELDLSETLKSIRIPYLILQGDTDIVTSTKSLTNFIDTANNDNLSFQLVRNSGHMPSASGMDTIINKLINFCSFTPKTDHRLTEESVAKI